MNKQKILFLGPKESFELVKKELMEYDLLMFCYNNNFWLQKFPTAFVQKIMYYNFGLKDLMRLVLPRPRNQIVRSRLFEVPSTKT